MVFKFCQCAHHDLLISGYCSSQLSLNALVQARLLLLYLNDTQLHIDLWNTALIASGKLLKPSAQAISMSSTPRCCSPISTLNQNLAPSFSATHMPISSFWPSTLMPSAKNIDLLITCLSWRIFTTRQSR